MDLRYACVCVHTDIRKIHMQDGSEYILPQAFVVCLFNEAPSFFSLAVWYSRGPCGCADVTGKPPTRWKDSCVAFPIFHCSVPAAVDSGVGLGAEGLAFL